MKCKQGDLARIIHAIRPENIGRSVKVAEYIGRFEQGQHFEFRGLVCKCAVTDHYWWIEAADLSIMFGPSGRAFIADSWLEPVRPLKLTKTQQKEVDFEL